MGLVTALVATSAALSIGSSVAGGIGASRAAAAAKREGKAMANDALDRGEQDAKRYGMQLADLLGRQRAVGASSGVDTTQGSAAQLAKQTAAFGAEDIRTIRENALREAYALRRGANNQAAALRANAAQQFAGGFSTALSFGANAWQSYNANLPGRARTAAGVTRSAIASRAGTVNMGPVGTASGWRP